MAITAGPRKRAENVSVGQSSDNNLQRSASSISNRVEFVTNGPNFTQIPATTMEPGATPRHSILSGDNGSAASVANIPIGNGLYAPGTALGRA